MSDEQLHQDLDPSISDHKTNYDYLSDKFKTYKEGTEELDLDTTLNKLATSYTELEKKFSSRSILKDSKQELDLSGYDEEFLTNNKDLVDLAKEARLDKDSLSKLTDMYNSKIKQVLEYKEQEVYDDTVSQLESIWGKDTEKQINYARLAVSKLGLSEEETDKVGNSLAFIKLAAAFGSQLGEDTVSNKPTSTSSIQELMSNPAYYDSKHSDHKSIKEQVAQYYKQNF